MLDFTPVSKREKTVAEFTANLTANDLRNLTNEMVDTQQQLIADCTDADVVFQPVDAQANDTFASADTDANIAWTLGHVIVHATASSEEGAALGSELARGVEVRGRSRSEVAWETVTTIAQCRQRLEESRRMRLASLDMWPDEPYLDGAHSYEPIPSFGPMNAVSRFVLGLYHDSSHLEQIKDIVAQAKAGRA